MLKRNHAATDDMLRSVTKDGSDKERDILVARMCDVENSMTNRPGLSPNKLVLGQNSKMSNTRGKKG